MCGIVAAYSSKKNIRSYYTQIERSLALLRHRGPDDYGIKVFDQSIMGLARLSIIDIEHGSQPFTSVCGDYTICFNGEIVNYKEIKQDLLDKGQIFKTGTIQQEVLAI